MHKLPQKSFEDDGMLDNDIDELFSQLEHFTPPDDFVARVMGAVARLPLPQYIVPASPVCEDIEGLIVHSEHLQPS